MFSVEPVAAVRQHARRKRGLLPVVPKSAEHFHNSGHDREQAAPNYTATITITPAVTLCSIHSSLTAHKRPDLLPSTLRLISAVISKAEPSLLSS